MFKIKPGKLTLRDLKYLVYSREKISIDENAYSSIKRSYEVVQNAAKGDESIYGVNTGFGQLANKKINPSQLIELQKKIILSHASGVGRPFPNEISKLILLLKINSLAIGCSGVSIKLINTMVALYNLGVYPVIPSQGSVGASGDLAPLAHMAMVLIGEGEVYLRNKVISSKEALNLFGMKPLTLGEKEGLSLLNGTQVSTAVALIGLFEIEKIFSIACISGALTTDAILGSVQPFDDFIHKMKNLHDQSVVASLIKNLLSGSEILRSHKNCDKVQDPYSIRCQPQVMGAILNSINNARKNLINEANSVSDNPVVCIKTRKIISGGNFHAELIAINSDLLSIACTEIGAISERRIALLIDSNLSGLPPFLVKNAGLNSGFMMAHVTASSLASENKVLSHPASIDSLPTSANQEDHVSMGTFAARKFLKITENVLYILAIETLAACQGIDFKKPLKTSIALQSKLKLLRDAIPFYNEDRYFAKDINLSRSVICQSDYYENICFKLFYKDML